MKINTLFLIALSIGSSFARDDFFGDIVRAKLFEKTDFKVPTITINLSDEDYNNFFLKYQCERDMNLRYLKRNDDCYTAPWVDLDYAMGKIFKHNYIDKSIITDSKDLSIINSTNITLSDFEYIVTKYSNFSLEKIMSTSYGLIKIPDYAAENAGLTFDLDGDVTEIPKIKFSVGGKYTKSFEKLGYNIKIKKDKLFERKQIRLRSEAVDPSFLREKIAYDICNLVELPSLSSNFVNVYFNKRYMGLFAMRDAFKSQWVEFTFGEKNTTHLYTCDRNYGSNVYFNCINDDEDIVDDVDFKAFQDRLANTKSREELEKFFDVETFMKWQALKYLFGSWDHITNAHNSYLYMYHDTNSGKDMWIPLLYDFDSEFGAYKDSNPRRTFNKEIYDGTNPLFDLLNIKEDNPEIIGYLSEIMQKAFNPKKLIPRIDQLKEFIAPYVKQDRTPDANGNLPGRVKRVNIKIEDYFSYDDFKNNSEFTTVKLRKYQSDKVYNDDYIIGLKQWMIERFKFVCETYDIDCSYAEEYLGEPDYTVETVLYEEKNGGCHNSGYNCCSLAETVVQTTDQVGKWGIEGEDWCLIDENNSEECWSEKLGYPCCKLKKTKISYTSRSTGKELYYGVENNDWCGITDLQLCPSGGEYKCCKGCEIAYTDSEDWGIENGEWCSIPHSCKKATTTATTTTTTTTTTTRTTTTTTTTTTRTTTTTTTTVTKTTTTTTTTAASTPTSDSQCASANSACGGTEYPNAPNCCEPGYFCWKYFSHVHQCLGEDMKNSLPSGVDVVKPNESEVAEAYAVCGGLDFPDAPIHCVSGYACQRKNPNYHQCIPIQAFEQQEQNENQNQEQNQNQNQDQNQNQNEQNQNEQNQNEQNQNQNQDQNQNQQPDNGNGNNQCTNDFEFCNPNAPNCCQQGSICWMGFDFNYYCMPGFWWAFPTN